MHTALLSLHFYFDHMHWMRDKLRSHCQHLSPDILYFALLNLRANPYQLHRLRFRLLSHCAYLHDLQLPLFNLFN
jgi:hypothetical protein